MKELDNKYKTWYYAIIAKAVSEYRLYDSKYYEKHHIIPKSLGGTDEADNIVCLTFKEHYIVHLLLTRFTIGKNRMKMCFALHTFFHFNHRRPEVKRSVLYESHKKMYIEACKNRKPSYIDDTVYTFNNSLTNEMFIGTRSAFKAHSKLSYQEIYNIVSGRLRHSKKWGVMQEDGTYSYDNKSIRGKAKSLKCPHCNRVVSKANYARWHGDNCKSVDPDGHSIRVKQVASINTKTSFN